jgi:VanZ family protein
LSFLPLGFLAAAGHRSFGPRRAALLGLGAGGLFEAGQIFLATRTAEITDVLAAGAGSALGAGAWRWGMAVLAGARSAARAVELESETDAALSRRRFPR